MSKIWFSSCLVAILALSRGANGDILPRVDNTKWLGVFTGASNLSTGALSNGDPSGLTPYTLNATFRLDGPLDNQGTPDLPAPYVVGSVGGADFSIPTFEAVQKELVGTVRGLQVCLVWDADPGIWRTVSELDTYHASFGDVVLFGDPNHLANGVAGSSGGQFDVLYNTSGFAFQPTTMSPAAGFTVGDHEVIDSSTGAFAGGSSASDALLVGQFENLLANGITQTRNLRFAGKDLATDLTIPVHLGHSLAEYAVYAADVLGPDGGVGDFQLEVSNFVANIDIIGGTQQSLVKKDGLQIQNLRGQDTGYTTDIRFSTVLSQLHFPGVNNRAYDDYQDVGVFQGSFTYVSVPEASSVMLCLVGAGIGAFGFWRRSDRQSKSRVSMQFPA